MYMYLCIQDILHIHDIQVHVYIHIYIQNLYVCIP